MKPPSANPYCAPPACLHQFNNLHVLVAIIQNKKKKNETIQNKLYAQVRGKSSSYYTTRLY